MAPPRHKPVPTAVIPQVPKTRTVNERAAVTTTTPGNKPKVAATAKATTAAKGAVTAKRAESIPIKEPRNFAVGIWHTRGIAPTKIAVSALSWDHEPVTEFQRQSVLQKPVF
jgi:hypothetical protein